MKTIYFIRHGQSEANEDWHIQKTKQEKDIQLTHLGRDQARVAGEMLLHKFQWQGDVTNKMEFYVSPWARAAQTFQIISNELELPLVPDTTVKYHSGITEHHMNLVNHKENWKIFVKYKKSDWLIPKFMNTKFEGGETLNNVLKRAKVFLKELRASKADTIVVVAHGQFIKLVLSVLDGIDPHDIVHPKNCEIITRVIK